MFPELRILNLIIPIYPLCVAFGFLVATIVLIKLSNRTGLTENQTFSLMCFTEIGVILGGKILFLIINFRDLDSYVNSFGIIGLFSKTGYVFYGGLFGGIIAIFIYSKIYKLNYSSNLNIIILVTPLIHCFGRLGCFCSGCCYGIEWDGIVSVYLNGTRRFPVQLFEACGNFILFFFLYFIFNKKSKMIYAWYFIWYGCFRLIIERFRGDRSRGFIGRISVSSFISLIVITIGIFIFVIHIQKRKKTGETNGKI